MEVFCVEDSEIVDLFWQRQEAALVKAQEKYGRRIYCTANNILHDEEDAKECANDTLLRAWEAIPPNRPSLLGAFLSKIVRNLAINRWKAKGAEKRGGNQTDLLLSELQECIPASGGLDELYESAVVVQSINGCLQAMEQASRVVFVLRYFHGETISAISERFEMNENKVKSILFRARKKLKTQLEKEGVVL